MSINNPDFENYLGQKYPAKLEIKDTTESNTSASYLDLLLSIESDGQLRTSLYDKRDDFNFQISNSPFLSSNIPSSPAYGVFISQLIRYARTCSSDECFILSAARLSSKLLGQGYVMERLKSSLRKFYGRYGILSNIMKSPSPKCSMTFWDMTICKIMTPSIDQTLHECANLLPNWTLLLPILTLLPNFGGFHRTLQRVRLANRGRLLLRIPGPVPFGTCNCSNVETILSGLVMSTDLLSFEHLSVLLFALLNEKVLIILSLNQSECRKLLRSVSSRIIFSRDTGIEKSTCKSSCRPLFFAIRRRSSKDLFSLCFFLKRPFRRTPWDRRFLRTSGFNKGR